MASSRTKSAVVDGDIAVAAVKVGDLNLRVHTTGELRASHSMMLSAPQVGGGALQITHLLRSGTPVKKGQIVLEFDPSEQQYKLEQSRSELQLALEKSNKSRLEMKQAQQNIDKMHVASPMDGVIAIEKNVDSTGGMFWGGMSLPDYREGDQVRPGNAIAKVIDPSDMEMLAKADERARGNIRAGQAAEIQFDALPGQVFHGTVKTVAGMAMKNFWEDAASGSFEVTIQLPNTDTRLRAGLTAEVIIAGDEKKKIAYIPRQAVFLKDGKRVAYVKSGSSFEAREVKVQAESESRAAIEGLKPGTEVALLDPAAPKKQSEAPAAEPNLGGRRK